jgi:hypothetical protein
MTTGSQMKVSVLSELPSHWSNYPYVRWLLNMPLPLRMQLVDYLMDSPDATTILPLAIINWSGEGPD